MKTAEELFNEYFSEAGQTLKVWFIEALTEHDNEIKAMIDEIELFRPCSQCGGEGKVCIGEHFVSRDMAIDAGDLSFEGQHFGYEYAQCDCGGGMIPKEPEEIQQALTELRDKL